MINKHSVSMPSVAQRQSGVVLAISLVMLLALTLIGVTGSRVTSLEEKMAANSKDKNLAFQAAEATLRFVETNLTTNKPAFNYTADYATQGQGGLYTLVDATGNPKVDSAGNPWQDFYETVDWYSTTKVSTYDNVTTGGKKLGGLFRSPAYIIEKISSTPSDSSMEGASLEGGTQKTISQAEIAILRITAHGWGSNNAIATVQSIVKVSYK